MLATKPYKWWLGHQVLPKKKRGGSCWHIGKTPFASICSLSVEGSSRYLCHPGGIGFTLGQETSLGERRHATTNCHLGWPCSKFVPRMAWSELNQVSTDQRPWSFDDGSDLTGQRCIRSFMELFFFFFYLFVCHICLIERLSAHHIVHSSTGVFLDGWGVNLWGTSQHLLHGWSNHSEGHGFSLIMSESVIIQLQSSGWDRKPICSCNKLFFVVKKPPWAQNGTVACYMVAG